MLTVGDGPADAVVIGGPHPNEPVGFLAVTALITPLSAGDHHFDRTLPETAALMRLMDEVEPSLVCSLHNGEHHGAFFYVNRDDPALARELAELPGLQGLPLHHSGRSPLPSTPRPAERRWERLSARAPAAPTTPPGSVRCTW